VQDAGSCVIYEHEPGSLLFFRVSSCLGYSRPAKVLHTEKKLKMEVKDQIASVDPEKGPAVSVSQRPQSASPTPIVPSLSENQSSFLNFLMRWNSKIESLSGFEARGIARVLPEDRDPWSRTADAQMFLLFFGANVSINNLTVGLFGPLVFELGFLDASLCAVGGAAAGSLSTAYMATWGAASGCRTMVGFRSSSQHVLVRS
jgi:hypothetical protein